jgi:hypothetical protein
MRNNQHGRIHELQLLEHADKLNAFSSFIAADPHGFWGDF